MVLAMQEYCYLQLEAIRCRQKEIADRKEILRKDAYLDLTKIVEEYIGNGLSQRSYDSYMSKILNWELFNIKYACNAKDTVLTIVNEVLHQVCEEHDCISMWEMYNAYRKANRNEYKDYL